MISMFLCVMLGVILYPLIDEYILPKLHELKDKIFK